MTEAIPIPSIEYCEIFSLVLNMVHQNAAHMVEYQHYVVNMINPIIKYA